MSKIVHQTSDAPAAIGPYSQAISCNHLVFCSGQLPIDVSTGEMAADIASQTKMALENLASILTASGSSLSDVLKTTVFMTNLSQFASMNEIYGEFFPNGAPARSTVQVAKLPKGALIEIEAIAAKSDILSDG